MPAYAITPRELSALRPSVPPHAQTMALGALAPWWLEGMSHPTLRPALGFAPVLVATGKDFHQSHPALRRAFLLPLQWRRDTEHSGLPRAWNELADQVKTCVLGADRAKDGWGLTLADGLHERVDLSSLREDWLAPDSAFGILSASLLLARAGIPLDPRKGLVTACGREGRLREPGLREEKAVLCQTLNILLFAVGNGPNGVPVPWTALPVNSPWAEGLDTFFRAQLSNASLSEFPMRCAWPSLLKPSPALADAAASCRRVLGEAWVSQPVRGDDGGELPKMLGNDKVLKTVVETLAGQAQGENRKWLPIVGDAGRGKTTLIRHALRHPVLCERFGGNRHFVNLSQLKSAAELWKKLVQHFRLESADEGNAKKDGENNPSTEESVLAYLANAGVPCLLVLDNLEDAWDADRNATRRALCQLAHLPALCLALTIRRNPEDWGNVPALEPLHPNRLSVAMAAGLFDPPLEKSALAQLVEQFSGHALSLALLAKTWKHQGPWNPDDFLAAAKEDWEAALGDEEHGDKSLVGAMRLTLRDPLLAPDKAGGRLLALMAWEERQEVRWDQWEPILREKFSVQDIRKARLRLKELTLVKERSALPKDPLEEDEIYWEMTQNHRLPLRKLMPLTLEMAKGVVGMETKTAWGGRDHAVNCLLEWHREGVEGEVLRRVLEECVMAREWTSEPWAVYALCLDSLDHAAGRRWAMMRLLKTPNDFSDTDAHLLSQWWVCLREGETEWAKKLEACHRMGILFSGAISKCKKYSKLCSMSAEEFHRKFAAPARDELIASLFSDVPKKEGGPPSFELTFSERKKLEVLQKNLLLSQQEPILREMASRLETMTLDEQMSWLAAEYEQYETAHRYGLTDLGRAAKNRIKQWPAVPPNSLSEGICLLELLQDVPVPRRKKELDIDWFDAEPSPAERSNRARGKARKNIASRTIKHIQTFEDCLMFLSLSPFLWRSMAPWEKIEDLDGIQPMDWFRLAAFSHDVEHLRRVSLCQLRNREDLEEAIRIIIHLESCRHNDAIDRAMMEEASGLDLNCAYDILVKSPPPPTPPSPFENIFRRLVRRWIAVIRLDPDKEQYPVLFAIQNLTHLGQLFEGSELKNTLNRNITRHILIPWTALTLDELSAADFFELTADELEKYVGVLSAVAPFVGSAVVWSLLTTRIVPAFGEVRTRLVLPHNVHDEKWTPEDQEILEGLGLDRRIYDFNRAIAICGNLAKTCATPAQQTQWTAWESNELRPFTEDEFPPLSDPGL